MRNSKKKGNEPTAEEMVLALENSLAQRLIEENIATEDGLPLDFYDHPFAMQVLDDMYSLERDIVGLKAAQITFTTMATNAVLCLAHDKHIDIIYTLPTYDDVRIFSGGKVNRIIAQNPMYQSWVPNKDTMEQKIVGKNVIHFRGTHISKAATMVSSDLNVHDELDSSNQVVVEQYATRLQHSNLKRTWWFSHPSVPDNGVDKKWKLSDQKHWMIKCTDCKKWQYLDWPHSFDIEKERYMCKYCHATITDEQRREGQWVPRRGREDAEFSGYWIPLWLLIKVSAHDVIKYHDTKAPDYFYNKVAGLPYVGGGNVVLQKTVYQNLTPEDWDEKAGRIIIGVDPGETIRWVVGNKSGLRGCYESTDYGDIERTLETYKNSICMIDAGGDLIEPRRLRARFRGRVFLVYYQRDRKTMQLVRWGDKDESGQVLADRNRMIQLVVDELGEKKLPLHYRQNRDAEWYDYWLHFSHIYRVVDEDPATKMPIHKWERSDRDDFVHATVYWRIGMMRFGSRGTIIKSSSTHKKPQPNSYMVTPDGRTGINPLTKTIDETIKRVGVVYTPDDQGDWRDA